MCFVAATVANRGKSFVPKLVSRVVDIEGKDVRDPETGQLVASPEAVLRADLHDAGISDEEMELVRKGMWKVVNEPGGTGKKAKVPSVEVAGKTGTAQFWREINGKEEKDNHTWFISFAPYETPKFAVCVFVQGAKSGGGVSAPIAQRILEQSLALEKGYDPGVTWLDPAPGSFAQVDEVNFKSGPIYTGDAVDRETADHHADPSTKPARKKPASVEASPDIKPDADERGSVSKKGPSEDAAEKRSFFERMFGPKKVSPPSSTPQTSPGKPAR
jgi:penicillin-binding protein 2